jgi:hypothetical protein
LNSEGYTYDVFLSYSSRDKVEVEALAEKLRRDGFAVWFDRWCIPPGANIYREVVGGVQHCRFLVQILSLHGLGSEWAASEREIVLIDDPGNRNKRFIPLLLASVELPPDLRRFSYVDYREARDDAYERLRLHLAGGKQAVAAGRSRLKPSSARKTAAVFHGGAAPLAPPHLFGRETDFEAVCHRVIGADRQMPAVIAIYGWPGVGKTALAAQVAHADRIRDRFPDGVLWATVGDNPDYDEILRLWAVARGIHSGSDAASREIRLREHLSDKRVLVVLDDVWAPDTSRLMVAGNSGRTLMTTRAPAIAHLFVTTQANVLRLGVLSADDALALLADVAPTAVDRSTGPSQDLCARLEYLPLAIKVAGRLLQVRAEIDGSFGLNELFAELADRERLLDEAPPGDIPFPAASISQTVGALLMTSIEHLAAAMRERFLDLAVLAPAPAIFSRDHASITMVARGGELNRTLSAFYNNGLIEPLGGGQYWIHSMMVATAEWIRHER